MGWMLAGEQPFLGRMAGIAFSLGCLLTWVPCTPTTSPISLRVRLRRDAACQLPALSAGEMQGIQTGSFVSSCESLNSKESCLQGCHGLVLGWEDGMY